MDGAGAGADAFGSSSASLTWRDFLERMRKPAAAELVNSIKSFIVNFTSKAPDPDKDGAAVQEFLTNMEGAFKAHSLWAGCSEEELESAGEGLEKYVMTKLYNRAFASLPEDKKQDEELFLKMSLVQQFIRPEHLDIQPTFQNETSWLLAQKELQKINMYKAPRDKLVCILNCCKVINNLLLNASLASSENPPGADEFLPVLIYVTIKANPPELHSNLLYIQRYRCQSRLVSEAAYYFTNILSAESFIWNIDAKALSMDEEEFQKNMESARALILGLSGGLEGVTNQNARDSQKSSPVEYQGHLTENIKPNKVSSEQSTTMSHPQVYASETSKESDQTEEHYTSKKASTSDLETKGARDILKEDQLNRYFSEYPFLYASAGDLTVNDVESLLNSYKQLVLKYVSLSKGTGISSPPVTEQLTEIEKECEQSGTIVGETNTLKFDEFVEAVEDSMVSSEDRAAAMVAEKTENSIMVTNDENSS